MTRILALVVGLLLALTGCSLSGVVYDAPLPGGADVGEDPITLQADFEDVLDLVPQSSVKVDHVAVGRVSDIQLNDDGRSARVTLIVNRDANLPDGTTARLEQTSLLGEKYVALVRPENDAGSLADGDTIALADTSAAVEVEELFGSLSLLLNGGGIGQFQEISRELQEVGDKPEEIKAFMRQMDRFVSTLNDRRDAITGAIDGVHRLSKALEEDTGKIESALDGLSPGMKTLAEQRPQLVKMLESLDRLSAITVKTLNESQENIVEDFKLMAPILRQLAKAGADLPYSLEILLTYPFPDEVLKAIEGDYLNVFVTTNFRTLPAGCSGFGCTWPQPGGGAVTGSGGAGAPQGSDDAPMLLPPTDSPLPGAPSSSVPGPSITDPSNPGSGDPSDPGSGDPSSPGSEDPSDPGSGDPSDPSSDDSSSPDISSGATTEGD